MTKPLGKAIEDSTTLDSDAINSLVDELFLELDKLAAKTATPYDDMAVGFLKRAIKVALPIILKVVKV